ncbi:Rha family transcriptional regulator [Serratia symbiotica]|uniref:Rha family transcriptional regulator n=1 Tax=Serratia symbiotica TaxID=138074 RepID=UPI003EC02FAE
MNEYTDAIGRKLPCYQITRDGFAFLTMGFTGQRAAQFKEAYITAFNQMELALIKPVDTSTAAHNAHVVYLYMSKIHRVTCLKSIAYGWRNFIRCWWPLNPR